MACAAIDIGGVILNPPRPDFASPVRAYETMTASRILDLPMTWPIMPCEGVVSYIIFAGATKIAPGALPAGGILPRHAGLRPGHPRLACLDAAKTRMSE